MPSQPHGVADPLGITIPASLLGLLGISLGSAVTATTVKRVKDVTSAENVAASGGRDHPPRLAQIFLVEDGAFADKVVDISKFQGFVVTILLVVAYIAVVVNTIGAARTAQDVNSIPRLNDTWLILLAISHGAYVTAKIPTSAGKSIPNMDMRNNYPEDYSIQKRAALSSKAEASIYP